LPTKDKVVREDDSFDFAKYELDKINNTALFPYTLGFVFKTMSVMKT